MYKFGYNLSKKIVLDFFIGLYGYGFRNYVALCSLLKFWDEMVKQGIGLPKGHAVEPYFPLLKAQRSKEPFDGVIKRFFWAVLDTNGIPSTPSFAFALRGRWGPTTLENENPDSITGVVWAVLSFYCHPFLPRRLY